MGEFIEPGTKIISGVRCPHQCVETDYEYEKIRGTLVSPSGKKVEYNMFKCNKCGILAMRGDKACEIEIVYKNYEFVHLPKVPKDKPLTKAQIRNAQYHTACAVADAQGKPRPKKKGKQEKPAMDTPDYVFRGEAPRYMQRNASQPFQGGGVSPK